MEQHQPKSLKASVSYKDTSASIETADTSIYDLSLVAIITIGFISTVYLIKWGKGK